MLVVGTYREPEVRLTADHPLTTTLASLHRQDVVQRIPIRGLSHEEVATYLAQEAGEPLPQALVRVIENETNGNPFYAREVLLHLTEEAKLLWRGSLVDRSQHRRAGHPRGRSPGRQPACRPASPDTREMLTLAACFSRGFSFLAAESAMVRSEDVLLDSLDEALYAGLIQLSADGPSRYEFSHAIVRHTLYEGLNPDRRARLHRRIALAP